MTMSINRELVFVIPTYREYENLVRLIPRILKLYPEAKIVISDDNSQDGTEDFIKHQQQLGFEVYLVNNSRKNGIGPAILRGIDFALQKLNTDIIIQMDADFSHRPEDVEKLLHGIELADVVIGTKFSKDSKLKGWPWRRKILSKLGNLYIKFWLGLPVFEATSGFKCYKTKFLKMLDLSRIKSKGFIFQTEIIYRLWKKGARLIEVPIVFENRKRGESKMNLSIVFEGLIRPVLLRCNSLIGRI